MEPQKNLQDIKPDANILKVTVNVYYLADVEAHLIAMNIENTADQCPNQRLRKKQTSSWLVPPKPTDERK